MTTEQWTTDEVRAAQIMSIALEIIGLPDAKRSTIIGFIIHIARNDRGVA